MALYLLNLRRRTKYSEYQSFVIRASSETIARDLAFYTACGASDWRNYKVASCRIVNPKGKPRVIMRNYHHFGKWKNINTEMDDMS